MVEHGAGHLVQRPPTQGQISTPAVSMLAFTQTGAASFLSSVSLCSRSLPLCNRAPHFASSGGTESSVGSWPTWPHHADDVFTGQKIGNMKAAVLVRQYQTGVVPDMGMRAPLLP